MGGDLADDLIEIAENGVARSRGVLATFSWQRGYGCFSVGPSDLEALKDSIDRREQHHKTRTFQHEFRMLLKKYRVEYDEAYVWD